MFTVCPDMVGNVPMEPTTNGTSSLYIMINQTFPCEDQVLGWRYQTGSHDLDTDVAYAAIWRPTNPDRSRFKLIHKVALRSEALTVQKQFLEVPVSVQVILQLSHINCGNKSI